MIFDALKAIPDALEVVFDGLRVISERPALCSLVVFLQIVETGRYSRYAATKVAYGF